LRRRSERKCPTDASFSYFQRPRNYWHNRYRNYGNRWRRIYWNYWNRKYRDWKHWHRRYWIHRHWRGWNNWNTAIFAGWLDADDLQLPVRAIDSLPHG
jgi:hypothetical protein